MIALPTFSRTRVAAASLLLTAFLFVAPSRTNEPPDVNAAAGAALAGAPATPIDEAAPAVLRAAAGPRRSGQVPAPQRPALAGMVVGIDPETGEMGMPTPEQLRALSGSPQYQVDHSAAGLVEVHHPDGSVSIDLQGRFQEYATVRIGPDGKLIFRCVDGDENAKRAIERSAPVATPDIAAPVPAALEER